MNQNHRETVSLLFSLVIIVASAITVREFLLPLTWAGVICVATWPVYQRIRQWVRGHSLIASTLMVGIITLVIAIPFLWLTIALTHEVETMSNFFIHAHAHGIPFPAWLDHIPYLGSALKPTWQQTLAQPRGVADLVKGSLHSSMQPLTSIAKAFGSQVAHRAMALGFTILSLFFFYKDGDVLRQHLQAMGKYFLQDRWQRYSDNVPGAINATVNGLILVGFGIGLLMGISYAIAGVPAPVLLGVITGIMAIIPFAVLIAFAIVAFLLLLQAKLIAMLVILILGTCVMFIADHFVRPSIIGGATQLPFLAVLFGILGGVKTFGIVGLFLGPMIMVLFITLWHEADLFQVPNRTVV